jgi:predicted dehydrogenase
MNPPTLSRRNAVGQVMGGVLGAAASVPRARGASDRLRIAAAGIGGMGANYIAGCATEDIVALCDVDDAKAAPVFDKYPRAARFRDFRRMLDRAAAFDAVIVGTPDHTHAAIALAAMQLGKHVYCAKPMTRTIAEARRLAWQAQERKLATQMSVQSSMSPKACQTIDWIRAGVAGQVREVHVWSDRPVWPQAAERPAALPAVPSTLDWNLWLGPAPARPFHPVYHPFNWRGWVDFGTGALGDMGCHTLHVIVRALDLGLPDRVSASAPVHYLPAFGEDRDMTWIRARRARAPETFPDASIVTWQFGPVRVTWYDGGLKPPAPAPWPAGEPMGGDGILFVGDRGVVHSGFTGGPRLLGQPGFAAPASTLVPVDDHYQEWIRACKGGPAASCEFGFGARLTEICLLGAIAQRLPGRLLEWEKTKGAFPRDPEASALVDPPARTGW